MFNILSILVDVIVLATFQRRSPIQNRPDEAELPTACENRMHKRR